MDTNKLQDILTWMKTTDLVELCWKRGGEGLEFRLETAPPPEARFPATSLIPVLSPAVGYFRWAAPGKARKANDGAAVSSGDVVGLVDTGEGVVDVTAPSAGKVLKTMVEEGKAVEYGQPLMVLAPGA